MSNCTNVCGIRSKALEQLKEEDWLEVKRPSGRLLKVRLNKHGRYALWDTQENEVETFGSLVELKKRLREFP